MQNRFHRILSIRGTNFRACSASWKMWTFLHVQSMLSIRGTNFVAHWAYGELISSHAEHTGNRCQQKKFHACVPLSKLDQWHTGRLRKRDSLQTGGGEWGGWGAKSYDGEKAWASVNHSIFSGFTTQCCRRLCRWLQLAQLAKGKKSRP